MKVLIISHLPIMNFGSMGKTFKSLFSEFNANELCQLFIYPTKPCDSACSSYFRITDKDVLRGLLSIKTNSNVYNNVADEKIVTGYFENQADAKIYEKNRKKTPLKMLLRDAMWSLGRWYTKDMRSWLIQERPTCIFLAPGEAKFLYDIALKISKDFNIPIVTYVFDEHYFLNNPDSLLGRFQLMLLKKKIEKTMASSKHLVTICDELNESYSKYFGIRATTIMTGSDFVVENEHLDFTKYTSITYMGTLSCNRHVSISEIGLALDRINKEEQTNFYIDIYTDFNDKAIIEKLSQIDSIRIHGYVSGDEFKNVFLSNTIQLHVEAFDDESIDMVKHSISTKIANCLMASQVIMAYGPKAVASISYLSKTGAAFVCTEKNELSNFLKLVFNSDISDYSERRNKAVKTAKENHITKKNSLKLHNLLLEKSADNG